MLVLLTKLQPLRFKEVAKILIFSLLIGLIVIRHLSLDWVEYRDRDLESGSGKSF